MRRVIKSLALAGVMALGGLTGLGTTSVQAQGFGGYPGGGFGVYPGGGAYGQGYPGGVISGPGYGGSGGGINLGIGIGGNPAPQVGGYGGYSYGGFRGIYGGGGYSHHHHHHHHHHRGCGHGY